MSVDGSVDTVIQVMKAGAADYLPKPIDFDYLHLVVSKSISRREDEFDLRALRSQMDQGGVFHGMLSAAPAMRSVFRQIQQAAVSQRPVLVQGETGTGKELVARAIHAAGPRSGTPFLSVNCGAIPGSLLEAELFGHQKGAFTGASHNRVGIMQEVGHGTLVLDDIQQMPMKMQGMLLRAVEQMEIRPVGATQAVTVSFRLVSTTNQPLTELVDSGAFRQDLLFRLNVLPIDLPPLRERQDDVLLLADHFLRKHADESGRKVYRFGPDARRWLRSQPWPGNVRELEHAVERAVVFGTSSTITVADLDGTRHPHEEPASGRSVVLTLKEARDQFEREYLLDLVRQTEGNLAATARLAGLNRQYLYAKARKLGLSLTSGVVDKDAHGS